MKTATFTNWTKEEFVGYWDGKPKKIKPGESIYMPDYLARHFAKHLTNRELLREADGSLVIKDGDKMTSPKEPKDYPVYMELFNKAYTPQEDEVGEEDDDVETLIDTVNKQKEAENFEENASKNLNK